VKIISLVSRCEHTIGNVVFGHLAFVFIRAEMGSGGDFKLSLERMRR